MSPASLPTNALFIVLVISAGIDDEAIREALTTGAKGYVEKAAGLDEFMYALRAVAEGRVFFGPIVAGVVERLVKRHAATVLNPVAVPGDLAEPVTCQVA